MVPKFVILLTEPIERCPPSFCSFENFVEKVTNRVLGYCLTLFNQKKIGRIIIYAYGNFLYIKKRKRVSAKKKKEKKRERELCMHDIIISCAHDHLWLISACLRKHQENSSVADHGGESINGSLLPVHIRASIQLNGDI